VRPISVQSIRTYFIVYKEKKMNYSSASPNDSGTSGTIESTLRPRSLNKFYGIALVGGVLMIMSVFLTWYSFKITGTGAQEFSVSGLGSSDSTSTIAKITGEKASSAGFVVIFFGVALLMLASLGLWLNKKGFAIATIVFGGLAVAFTFLKVIQANDNASNVTSTGGLGVYLAFLGAVIALVGGIISLVRARK
jgi:hypothetical protein